MSDNRASHYLYSQNLPKQLDPSELGKLTELLCSGNKSVIEKLTLSHIRMVVNIARKLSYGRNVDEKVSVGLEGLVEAIDKFPKARASHEGEQKGITAYIAGYVRYKIKDYIAQDVIVNIPSRTQRSNKIRPPKTYSEGQIGSKINTGEDYLINDPIDWFDQHQSGVKDPRFNIIEINEILKMICKNDLDKIIIKLRRRGFNDNEIAEKTGLGISMVQSLRKKLEQRFDELWYGV